MELRHLRYFVAVAETGGFSAASRALHVSQSAISEQIADLEDEIQVPLIHRKNRTTTLTMYGEIFLERSREILRLSDDSIQLTRSAYRGETGKLTIGFFAGGVRHWFPLWIRQFRTLYPSISVSLVEMSPTAQHAALLSGSIDVGFSRPVPNALRSSLRMVRLYKEQLVVVLPRSHKLAGATALHIAELEAQRFVMNERANSPAVFDKVLSLCADAGFSPQIVTQASVSSGVIALVEAGEGIGVLPQGAEQLGSKDLAFIPVADEGATVDMVMAWSAMRDDAVLQQFVDLVRSRAKGRDALTATHAPQSGDTDFAATR